MGLLDSILGGAGNTGANDQGGGNTKAALLAGLLAMLASREGGQAGAAGGGGGLLGSLGGLLGGGGGGGGGLGGMLGGLLGGAQGQQGQGAQAAGPNENMVGAMGGLGGLTQLLQNAGLGDAVQSWIGTGANQPVSAEQIGQALDQGGHLQQLADSAGVSKEQAAQHLAELLPQVVDKLTPQGDMPQGEMNLASLAQHFLGK